MERPARDEGLPTSHQTGASPQPVASAHDRRRYDRKITPKSQQGNIRAAKDSNDEPRAIGVAVLILTSSSKQFRLDRVEVFEALKDQFAQCGSTVIVTLISQRLSSVLFLPRVTI